MIPQTCQSCESLPWAMWLPGLRFNLVGQLTSRPLHLSGIRRESTRRAGRTLSRTALWGGIALCPDLGNPAVCLYDGLLLGVTSAP
jgi:hypothetical protein